MWNLIKKRLSPFQHASFRQFFFAQSFSLIGTWSHELARAWLVLEISGTATALGTLLLCTALPGLFLTLHGGAVADRADCRRLLFITKIILTCSSLSFFIVAKFCHLQLWMILIFGLIEGFVNSYDGPAFTSLFARMVPRQDFQQALALNSTSYNISRMLGPALAGVIMRFLGPAYVFLFDAISYIGVLLIIRKAHLRDKVMSGPATKNRGFKSLVAGVMYFFREPVMRVKQLQFLFLLTLIVPMTTLVFRSFMKTKFHLDAAEFGFLFTFPAMGAMIGAIYFTLAPLRKPMRNLLLSIPAMVTALLIIRVLPTPNLTAVFLGICGFFTYISLASITQSLHLETPDDYRGRLGSLITMGFSSIAPLMSFPIGIYTDKFGYENTILHLTLLFSLASFALAISQYLLAQKILAVEKLRAQPQAAE